MVIVDIQKATMSDDMPQLMLACSFVLLIAVDNLKAA